MAARQRDLTRAGEADAVRSGVERPGWLLPRPQRPGQLSGKLLPRKLLAGELLAGELTSRELLLRELLLRELLSRKLLPRNLLPGERRSWAERAGGWLFGERSAACRSMARLGGAGPSQAHLASAGQTSPVLPAVRSALIPRAFRPAAVGRCRVRPAGRRTAGPSGAVLSVDRWLAARRPAAGKLARSLRPGMLGPAGETGPADETGLADFIAAGRPGLTRETRLAGETARRRARPRHRPRPRPRRGPRTARRARTTAHAVTARTPGQPRTPIPRTLISRPRTTRTAGLAS
ncbi:MAG TPA: hypothetical protein VHZ33_03665 [Trebonia sp.]|nr:hypothetical protein [Trebonia sp.]